MIKLMKLAWYFLLVNLFYALAKTQSPGRRGFVFFLLTQV